MPAPAIEADEIGAIAQLGERVLCKHEVVGSIPSGSTRVLDQLTLRFDGNVPGC